MCLCVYALVSFPSLNNPDIARIVRNLLVKMFRITQSTSIFILKFPYYCNLFSSRLITELPHSLNDIDHLEHEQTYAKALWNSFTYLITTIEWWEYKVRAVKKLLQIWYTIQFRSYKSFYWANNDIAIILFPRTIDCQTKNCYSIM